MFADIDLTEFPLVNINLNEIDKPIDFYEFTDFWEKIHDQKKPYIFLFKT